MAQTTTSISISMKARRLLLLVPLLALLLSGTFAGVAPHEAQAGSNGQHLAIWCGAMGWEFSVTGFNQNGQMTRWSGFRTSSSALPTINNWWKGWVSVMGRPTPGYGSWTQFGQFNVPASQWGDYYRVC